MDINKLKPKSFVYNALCIIITIMMMCLIVSPAYHDGKFVVGIGEIVMITIMGLAYIGYAIACVVYRQWFWLIFVSLCLGAMGYCIGVVLITWV